MVVDPVWLLVAHRLVAGGHGAHLVQLRLESVNEQADYQQDSQYDEPDRLNVALVITKVVGDQEENGNPTGDLHARAADAGPAESGGWDVLSGNTVIYLWYRLVGRHLLSFASAYARLRDGRAGTPMPFVCYTF